MTPQDLKVYTLQEIDGWRETMTETRYVKAEDAGRAILAAKKNVAQLVDNVHTSDMSEEEEKEAEALWEAWEAKARELIGGEG